jgi:hypothetical protein
MKLLQLFAFTASIASLSLCASAQTSTVDVQFGGLYANPISSPTIVVSGTGVFGDDLTTGSHLYWVCLDSVQESPGNQLAIYDVSTDPSVMQAGIFGPGGFDADARGAVIQATTNMFYAFQDQLLNTPGNSYNRAFQEAVWAVTYGYRVWGESGPLTSDVIDTVMTNYAPYIEEDPLIGDFLLSALTTPTGSSTVYFGNPTNDSSLQPVMFFPIPEPSTLTLASMLGVFLISRRRRD